jgi:hypothetical protein
MKRLRKESEILFARLEVPIVVVLKPGKNLLAEL